MLPTENENNPCPIAPPVIRKRAKSSPGQLTGTAYLSRVGGLEWCWGGQILSAVLTAGDSTCLLHLLFISTQVFDLTNSFLIIIRTLWKMIHGFINDGGAVCPAARASVNINLHIWQQDGRELSV